MSMCSCFKIFVHWHTSKSKSKYLYVLIKQTVSYMLFCKHSIVFFGSAGSIGWFWMGNLHKNTQLMLEFLKAPSLVLHFSYYTLMTFLMMLSVILLSILMILLSILSVIGHLICGNNLNWLLNLNLIYETLWTGVRSGLLISMLRKLSWFRLASLITMVLLMWRWMGLFLRKNHPLRCWGWLSLLNWIGALALSLLLKLLPRKLEPIHSMKFLSPEVALYLYKSNIRPCMEYCCHIWAGAPSFYLELLINYKNGYAGLLVLHLHLLLNPWLIVET